MIYASDSKLSKELKNSIEILVDQAVLELLIETIFLTILIHNSKTAGLLKFQFHFSVPLTICYKMHILFF